MFKKDFLLILLLTNQDAFGSYNNQSELQKEIQFLKEQSQYLKEYNQNLDKHILLSLISRQSNTPVQNHIYTSSSASSQSNPSIQIPDTAYQRIEKALQAFSLEKIDSVAIQTIIGKYKWMIGGGVLTSLYVYVWNQIYQINKLLNGQQNWHTFKEEIPLTRLTAINRNELFKELQLSICKKYLTPSDCYNSEKIMLKFLEDISHEKMLLEKYISYQEAISSCYLSKIFPTFKKIELIQESIARLNFLIDLYIEFFVVKEPNK